MSLTLSSARQFFISLLGSDRVDRKRGGMGWIGVDVRCEPNVSSGGDKASVVLHYKHRDAEPANRRERKHSRVLTLAWR